MATDTAPLPVNGNYGTQHPYGAVDTNQSSHHTGPATAATNGAGSAQATSSTPGNNLSSAVDGSNSTSVPKDEVGWYFVEQYYTTLSRSPEKLHLFYSKRSQFVSGVEAEKVSVSVGQRAINERIKELDIQDCKVRVSNVDSQESFKNIVVQVIGEMSNKAAPHRKFVQTFVLAEQPNGYFVLNDIFRYINEEEEEEIENEVVPEVIDTNAEAAETEPKTLTSSSDPVQQEHDAVQVDKKLEEQAPEAIAEDKPAETSVTNGAAVSETTEAEPTEAEPTEAETNEPALSTKEMPQVQAEEPELATSVEEPEKPKDPDPTPIASPPNQTKPTAVQETPIPAPAPPKPAAPKTWANLVAANRTPQPVIPSSTASPSPAPPTQPKATPPPATPTVTLPTLPTEDASSQPLQSPGAGWQTAGHENGKKQGRQQQTSGQGHPGNVLAYVKNVSDKVDASLLRSTLDGYGRLAYFDVSRPKNCAFVEFETMAGYQAAVAANPHVVGGESIWVEERRPRPNAYGGNFNGRGGGMRGGRGGSDGGRPNNQSGGGRGGFSKDGGRGGGGSGYTQRGRGGTVTPRGRGTS